MARVEGTVELGSVREAARASTLFPWSIGVFSGQRRRIEDFVGADLIALDVDGGCTLAEAGEIFRTFRHAIATTRNHGVPKLCGSTVKPACDRFRVLLFLEKTVTSAKDYYSTWAALTAPYPFVDVACKDPARMFFPCKEIITIQEEGLHVPVVPHVDPPKITTIHDVRKRLVKSLPLELSRARRYLRKLPAAVQGDGGRAACFHAACVLVQDFALGRDDALLLLEEDYNPRCEPSWTRKELEDKVDGAIKKIEPSRFGRLRISRERA